MIRCPPPPNERSVLPSDDHLSSEVGIEVAISDTGLKATAKSRAIAAIDRLLGGVFDVWIAKREAEAERIRARSRIDAAAQNAVVERIEAAAARGETEAARLVEHIAVSEIRAVANKAHVVDRAVEQLALPPPDHTEPDQQTDEIDPDWLGHFESYAEKASSEKVRDLWARVLAGEIRRPGAFSLMTLRLLAELDRQIAQWFQDAIELRVNGQFLTRSPDDEAGITGGPVGQAYVLGAGRLASACGACRGRHMVLGASCGRACRSIGRGPVSESASGQEDRGGNHSHHACRSRDSQHSA